MKWNFLNDEKKREQMLEYDLLSSLAEKGEMRAQDFLKNVPRNSNDYVDFYPAAALFHAGYISTNSKFQDVEDRLARALGETTRYTASVCCQIMLPEGKTFEYEGCTRDSWHSVDVRFFITADGYLKLEEISERKAARRQKRWDYFWSLATAVLVAIVSAGLFNYFALQRLNVEPQPNCIEPTAEAKLEGCLFCQLKSQKLPKCDNEQSKKF